MKRILGEMLWKIGFWLCKRNIFLGKVLLKACRRLSGGCSANSFKVLEVLNSKKIVATVLDK